MNKVFMMLIVLSVPWLGGCATMLSEGRWDRYPLEIKVAEGQKTSFHVAGLGRNDSVQITGQASKKLYLPVMGIGPNYSGVQYQVVCSKADGRKKRTYKISSGTNGFYWLNLVIPFLSPVGMLVDFATGAAFDLSPEEVVC